MGVKVAILLRIDMPRSAQHSCEVGFDKYRIFVVYHNSTLLGGIMLTVLRKICNFVLKLGWKMCDFVSKLGWKMSFI